MKKVVILIGSVASGKTTIARSLERGLKKADVPAKYVDINVNHGLSYLLTKTLTKVFRLRYKSNYLLTIRFNRPDLFCRLLGAVLLLDIIYAPIKLIYSVLLPGITKDVLLIDEYYVNGMVDYIYYTRRLCHHRGWLHNALLNAFAKLALKLSLALLRRRSCYIAVLLRNLRDSIEGWVKREQIPNVDVDHLLYRMAGATVMSGLMREMSGCEPLMFRVGDPRSDSPRIAGHILRRVIGRCASSKN